MFTPIIRIVMIACFGLLSASSLAANDSNEQSGRVISFSREIYPVFDGVSWQFIDYGGNVVHSNKYERIFSMNNRWIGYSGPNAFWGVIGDRIEFVTKEKVRPLGLIPTGHTLDMPATEDVAQLIMTQPPNDHERENVIRLYSFSKQDFVGGRYESFRYCRPCAAFTKIYEIENRRGAQRLVFGRMNWDDDYREIIADTGMPDFEYGSYYAFPDGRIKAPRTTKDFKNQIAEIWDNEKKLFEVPVSKGWVVHPDHAEGFYRTVFHEKDKSYSDGFITERGEFLVKGFKDVSHFSDGMARVYNHNKRREKDMYGFIDTTGRLVINTEYDEASHFLSGIAYVQQKYGYGSSKCDDVFTIDKSGKKVEQIYDKIERLAVENLVTLHKGVCLYSERDEEYNQIVEFGLMTVEGKRIWRIQESEEKDRFYDIIKRMLKQDFYRKDFYRNF